MKDPDGWQLDPDGNRITPPDKLAALRSQPRRGCSVLPFLAMTGALLLFWGVVALVVWEVTLG